ncbi:hypothetical protein [Pseudomonas sp. LP_7_YM]|uniref:hypothetical protein n=1 Tax=Pseudomonas sp. LP_7_YM TaxID=2485137 RepID=UPI0010621011|nr:hypothetical protein [Pseudomonas sp. LP_7_YM]TDV58884.1 hypothetical protein EC915_1224 [Pseudomonas sp. LP_7_YM]
MLGKPARVILAFTAVAPVSISLAYIFAARDRDWLMAILAVCVCLALGIISSWIVTAAVSKFEHLPISIKKVKSADKEVLGFFIAYALPLIFKGGSGQELGAWVLAGLMLMFVLWTTHALHVNPVLGLIGFHFYEVETQEGVTYLLITKKTINNLKAITTVIQLTEYGIVDSSIKG